MACRCVEKPTATTTTDAAYLPAETLTEHYEPWGASIAADILPVPLTNPLQSINTPQNRFTYNGKELQTDIGLFEYGFRWYDPMNARFTSVDPLANDYAYKTPYDYAENRPVNGIDLDGLEFMNSQAIIGGSTAGLFTSKELSLNEKTEIYNKGNNVSLALHGAALALAGGAVITVGGGLSSTLAIGSRILANSYGLSVSAGISSDVFSQVSLMTNDSDRKFNFTSPLTQFYQFGGADAIQPLLGSALELNSDGFSENSIFGEKFSVPNLFNSTVSGYLGNKASTLFGGPMGGSGNFSMQATGEIIGNMLTEGVQTTNIFTVIPKLFAPIPYSQGQSPTQAKIPYSSNQNALSPYRSDLINKKSNYVDVICND